MRVFHPDYPSLYLDRLDLFLVIHLEAEVRFDSLFVFSCDCLNIKEFNNIFKEVKTNKQVADPAILAHDRRNNCSIFVQFAKTTFGPKNVEFCRMQSVPFPIHESKNSGTAPT